MQNILVQDTPALAVTNLTKTFVQWQRSGKLKDIFKNIFAPQKKTVLAVNDINLCINKGEFTAYAGANGAGKSTTIKLLAGLLQPTEGQVQVLGLNPAQKRVQLMKRIGVLFGQRSELWWDFPIIASYEWKKKVWGIEEETYAKMLGLVTQMLELGPILNTYARELSLGQRMRADLGMLLLHNPEVLFLDEPTLGLDVLAKKNLIEFLKHINQQNKTTIVVTSHDMDDLQQMARRIVLLSHGKIVFDGSFDQLRTTRGENAKIKVRCAQQAAPDIEGLQNGTWQNGEIVFVYDPAHIKIEQVLQKICVLKEIEDIEIQKAPIEDVVASLYRELA